MRYLILLLSCITFWSCTSDLLNGEFNRIDKLITDTYNLESTYLDSLYNKYPSDYLAGMYAIKLIEIDSLKAAENVLSNFKNPKTFSLTARAVLLDKSNDSTEAETYYNLALNADVHKINKWANLYSFYHFQLKDKKLALDYLNKAIEMDTMFNRAIIEKAYQFSPVDQCNRIIQLLSKLNENYKDCLATSYLGDAYYACGEVELAEEFYSESNKIRENGFAYLGLGSIEHYNKLNYPSAERYYSSASMFDETRCQANTSLGWLSYDYNQYERAVDYMNKTLNECETTESYNEVISLLIKIKKIDEALDLNQQYEKKFQPNYYNSGFTLIISLLKNKFSSTKENQMINEYHKQYGDTAIEWLKSVMNDPNFSNKFDVDAQQKS